MQNPFCEAERVGDEMVCPLCELTWPVGTEDPPVCNQEEAEALRAEQESNYVRGLGV